MTIKSNYVYGVTLTSQLTEPVKHSIMSQTEVEIVSYKDISVIIAESDFFDYSMEDKVIVAKQLIRHQQTIEKIMGMGVIVIPMKLGTFVTNKSDAEHILSCGYLFIKDIMNKAIDKVEADVLAVWSDFPATLREIGNEKVVLDLKTSLLAEPEKTTTEDQKKLGCLVAGVLRAKKALIVENLSKELGAVSIRTISHEVIDDQMLFNTAFLIEKNALELFEKRLDEVNAEYKDKLNFRYIGPLPCYSFYTLEIEKINFDVIDDARKKLGLNEVANLTEIKKAYKTEAFIYHPDKNPGKEGTDRRFNDLNNAYRILVAYCTATPLENGENHSFNRKDIAEKPILVKLKD